MRNYTLHHVEDTETVQLVRKDIHDAFKHTGGRAVAKEVGWGGKLAGFLGALFLSHSAQAQGDPNATTKDKADGAAHDIGVWIPGGAGIDMALDGCDWLQWNGYQHFWDFLIGPRPEGYDDNELPDHLKKKYEKKGYQ